MVRPPPPRLYWLASNPKILEATELSKYMVKICFQNKLALNCSFLPLSWDTSVSKMESWFPWLLSLGFSLFRFVIIIIDAHWVVCDIVVSGKEHKTQEREALVSHAALDQAVWFGASHWPRFYFLFISQVKLVDCMAFFLSDATHWAVLPYLTCYEDSLFLYMDQ